MPPIARGLTTNDAGKARPADLGTGTPDGTKVLAGDGTWVAKGLAKPANPSAPAVPVIAPDGTVTTAPVSTLGGGATPRERGAYNNGTVYAVGDIFTYQAVRYAVATGFTGGSTPDLSKTIAYGPDPAQTAQVVISDDGTTAGFRTTVAGVAGILPLVVGTFVPDGGGGGGGGGGDGSDWQTVATYRWNRAGLPVAGTNINGLHWAGATGNPDLVGDTGSTGGTGSVVTTYHGAKYLESANAKIGATLSAALSTTPGSGPAAVIMRAARLGPVAATNLLTGFFLKVGGVHFALQYQDTRPTGQKLAWCAFRSDGIPVFPVTSDINQSGMADGQTLPHLLVDVIVRIVLDGASSKLYCNGVLQGTFDATTTPSTEFSADNIDFTDSSFRGMSAVSDIIVMPSDATPARIAAAEATIPAGA